jgi:hypothetical protein
VRRSLIALALACLALPAAAGGASSVVGGSAVAIQGAPWVAHVQYQDGPTSFYHCSASILDETHVVTAAHCLFTDAGVRAQPSQLTVHAGTTNFFSAAATDQPQVRAVASLRVHPGFAWSAQVDRDDVAVLVLATPLDLSGPSARAVALPSAGAAPARLGVSLAGYGRQDPSRPSSGQLASMSATLEAQGDCGSFASAIDGANGVLFCLTSPTSAVCSGDSGAGVVIAGATPTLVGVVDAANCTPGDDALAASLYAPEVLAFVQGNDTPPTAPRAATPPRLRWSGPVRVGSTLTCSAGGGRQTPVTASYTFLTADSGRVLQSGAKATYVVAARALHAAIRCRALVANDGGTLLVTTNASPNVAAAAPKKPKPKKKR